MPWRRLRLALFGCIRWMKAHCRHMPCICTVKVSQVWALHMPRYRFLFLECKITYHHNFSVSKCDDSTYERSYYDEDIPDVIQASEHRFVERKVVNLWISLMLVSWSVQVSGNKTNLIMTCTQTGHLQRTVHGCTTCRSQMNLSLLRKVGQHHRLWHVIMSGIAFSCSLCWKTTGHSAQPYTYHMVGIAEIDSQKQFVHGTYASNYLARKSYITTVISVRGSIRVQMGTVSPVVTIYLSHQADYYRAHRICGSDRWH